jgi:cell division septation protein DedD
MKDHRFIELLNLYIDRQITADETAELEAEIQSSPQRQAVYRQYCQIHAATKVVYESFRAGAENDVTAPTGRPAKIEVFERRRRVGWIHYAGGIAAAAACAGFLLVRSQPVAAPEASMTPAPVQTVAAAPVQVAPAAPAAAEVPAAKNLISLRNTNQAPDYTAMLVALREQDEERALAERLHTARAQSLFDDNLFDAKHPVPASEARPAQNRGAAAEFTAFQFQR